MDENLAKFLTIAVIVLGVFGFFAIAMITEEPKSDFRSCIMKCPSSWTGEFDNLECPRMCNELLGEEKQESCYVIYKKDNTQLINITLSNGSTISNPSLPIKVCGNKIFAIQDTGEQDE